MTIPQEDIRQNGFMSQLIRRFTSAEDWTRQHQSVNHNTTPVNGWVVDPHLWTRTGNYTFTVSVDATGWLYPGVKVWFVDSTSKYGVVYTSSYSAGSGLTTITLFTNSNFLMVTNPTVSYYSVSDIPAGFPDAFDYVFPITSGVGVITTATQVYGSFKTYGRRCVVNFAFSITINGTGGSTVVINAPCVSKATLGTSLGREDTTGKNLQIIWRINASTIILLFDANVYPGISGGVYYGVSENNF